MDERPEHLVFSMHYFSFVLISLPPVVLAMKLKLTFSLLLLLLAFQLWQLSYLAVSIRRFYLPDGRSVIALPAAIAVALLLYVLNSLFITAVQFTAGAVAIWML